MSDETEEPQIAHVIVEAIYKHARAGNVREVAQAIIAELREAGFEIRRPDNGQANRP
jgi:flavodoxin